MEKDLLNKTLTTRISEEDKEDFLAMCDKYALNSSEIIRRLIVKWTRIKRKEGNHSDIVDAAINVTVDLEME